MNVENLHLAMGRIPRNNKPRLSLLIFSSSVLYFETMICRGINCRGQWQTKEPKYTDRLT
ncbi:hypothetical protein M758_10G167900 [Ceratodon purpureus]|nr:hypothetical protein M758_10G167900 [Ceratodon purpureus]